MSEDDAICAQAAQLIQQACECTDEDMYDSLTRQAHHLLAPLVEIVVADAQYLRSGSTLYLEGLDEDEGAIQFVADAYTAGAHGYPKDEAQAELWRRRLDEPGVMSY